MKRIWTLCKDLPSGFHELDVSHILEVFPRPTLVHLEGDKTPPLFVSILLHGNEYSGLKSLQRLLTKYKDRLPRSLYLFIGNVMAAKLGVRTLAGQVDFNRCWPGAIMDPNQYSAMMQQVFEQVTQQGLFAAIDVHNNTGTNPHYACITDVTQDNRQLAAMFNHIGLVFKQPKGVSTMAFDGVCPAATLECGKPGDEVGIQHATELLDALLHLDHFPQRPVAAHDQHLVASLATVTVRKDIDFSFESEHQTDLWFTNDFEKKNFTEIKPDEVFAHTRVEKPLIVSDQDGLDITHRLIRQEQGKLFLKETLMPAMITLDKSIVRQDCLCYLLKDYHAEEILQR